MEISRHSRVSIKGYQKFCGRTNSCECLERSRINAIKNANETRTQEEWDEINKKTEETSLKKYGTKHFLQSQSVKNKIEQTHTEKYGYNRASKSQIVKDKTKQTNLEKYGVEYTSQLKETQLRTKQTNLEKYGVENIFQSEEVKDKIKQANLEKYGVEYNSQRPTTIEKRNETNLRLYGNIMPLNDCMKSRENRNISMFAGIIDRTKDKITPLFSIEEYHGTNIDNRYPWKCNGCGNEFEDHLDNGRMPRCPTCHPWTNSSNFEREIAEYIEQYYSIERNNRNIIGKELDILIPDLSLAIECNGLYWHSELNGKDRHYHLDKTTSCQEKNIHLIHVWEDQWRDKQDIVLSRINSLLGINDKIPARKCEISETNSGKFIDENHLQGNCPNTIKYGLEYNGQLIAMMTFGKPRFNKKHEWELLRYCTKKNTNIIGGSSKLFKHFINQTKPNSVISYANREWSNGNMYKTLGFNFINYTKPNYWYITNNTRYSRIKFQKHKLEKLLEFYNPNLTEWENMVMNEYDRIWDCGNSVWVLDK